MKKHKSEICIGEGIRLKVRGHTRIRQTRDSTCNFRHDTATAGRSPSIGPSNRDVEWQPNRNENNWDENYTRLHLDV